MALEQLLAAVEQDARAEAEAQIARGRQQAAELARTEAEQEARARAAPLAREEAKRRGALGAELAAARLRGRRLVARARQQYVDRVHVVVASRLVQLMRDERYLSTLPSQLDACLDYVGGSPVVVLATRELVPRLRGLVAGREGVSVEPDPALITGFRLVTEDDTLSVDATLEHAHEHWRRELDLALSRRLSGST